MAIKLRKKSKAELTQKAQKLYTKGGDIATRKGEKAYKKTMKKEGKFFSKDKTQYESVHGSGTYPEKFAKENIEFSKKKAEKAKAGAVKKAYDKNLMIKLLTARGYKIEKKKENR